MLNRTAFAKSFQVLSNSGPPRKYYSITEKGNTFLLELDSTWKDLAKAVRLTTKTKKDE